MVSSSNQKENIRYEELSESTKFLDYKKTMISPSHAFNKIMSKNFNESASFVNLENISDPSIVHMNEIVQNHTEKNHVQYVTFVYI